MGASVHPPQLVTVAEAPRGPWRPTTWASPPSAPPYHLPDRFHQERQGSPQRLPPRPAPLIDPEPHDHHVV